MEIHPAWEEEDLNSGRCVAFVSLTLGDDRVIGEALARITSGAIWQLPSEAGLTPAQARHAALQDRRRGTGPSYLRYGIAGREVFGVIPGHSRVQQLDAIASAEVVVLVVRLFREEDERALAPFLAVCDLLGVRRWMVCMLCYQLHSKRSDDAELRLRRVIDAQGLHGDQVRVVRWPVSGANEEAAGQTAMAIDALEPSPMAAPSGAHALLMRVDAYGPSPERKSWRAQAMGPLFRGDFRPRRVLVLQRNATHELSVLGGEPLHKDCALVPAWGRLQLQFQPKRWASFGMLASPSLVSKVRVVEGPVRTWEAIHRGFLPERLELWQAPGVCLDLRNLDLHWEEPHRAWLRAGFEWPVGLLKSELDRPAILVDGRTLFGTVQLQSCE